MADVLENSAHANDNLICKRTLNNVALINAINARLRLKDFDWIKTMLVNCKHNIKIMSIDYMIIWLRVTFATQRMFKNEWNDFLVCVRQELNQRKEDADVLLKGLE